MRPKPAARPHPLIVTQTSSPASPSTCDPNQQPGLILSLWPKPAARPHHLAAIPGAASPHPWACSAAPIGLHAALQTAPRTPHPVLLLHQGCGQSCLLQQLLLLSVLGCRVAAAEGPGAGSRFSRGRRWWPGCAGACGERWGCRPRHAPAVALQLQASLPRGLQPSCRCGQPARLPAARGRRVQRLSPPALEPQEGSCIMSAWGEEGRSLFHLFSSYKRVCASFCVWL